MLHVTERSVNERELVDALESMHGAPIVTIVSRTSPDLLKRGRVSGAVCPWSGVYKLSSRRAILASSYQKRVNRNRFRDAVDEVEFGDEKAFYEAVNSVPEFVPQSLWKGRGRRVSRMLVEHTGTRELYLPFLPMSPRGDHATSVVAIEEYRDESDSLISADDIAEFLPVKKVAESGQCWRVMKLSSIDIVIHGHETFRVSHSVQVQV